MPKKEISYEPLAVEKFMSNLPFREARPIWFDATSEILREYNLFFGRPIVSHVLIAIMAERQKDLIKNGSTKLSEGISIRFVSEKTGLPKSTVHDAIKILETEDILVRKENYIYFSYDEEGLPILNTKIPKATKALDRQLAKMEEIFNMRDQ